MQVGLSAAGTIVYNGYPFDGAYHASLNGRHVYDASGRVVMYTTWTLDVMAVIADDTLTTDVEMADIHRRLSHSGQELQIVNKGFGRPVRVGGAFKADVLFGPKPEVISWKPIGTTLAAEVHWQCTYHVKHCGEEIAAVRGVLAINYTIDLDYDSDGNTVRTIAGHILFVNGRIGRTLAENPEAFLGAIRATVPLGFTRRQKHHYNDAKNRIDFQFVDTEVPTHHNPFPEFMTQASGNHRISWNMHDGGRLKNSLSIKLTPRADVSQVQCWLYAIAMFRKRRDRQRLAKDDKGNNASTITTEFSIDEDLWGRPVSFSFEWMHLHSLKHFLQDTGLFEPIVDTDWTKWRTSMAGWAHDPRGNAKWSMANSDDVVVDLCMGYQQQYMQVNDAVSPKNIQAIISANFKNPTPDPKTSYLLFSQQIIPAQIRPSIQHEILQSPDSPYGTEDLNDSELPNFGQSGGIDTIIQQSGRARNTMYLVGTALRAGHPVPKSRISTVGGQPVTEVSNVFVQDIAHNALGVPVYRAVWMIGYTAPNNPRFVKPRPNVLEKVDEDGNASGPESANP